MKTKVYRLVEYCEDCPHFGLDSNKNPRCHKSEKNIPWSSYEPGFIPDWCSMEKE